MPYRKLIESDMPVSKINAEVGKVKRTLVGMPSTLHLWWSRTPLAINRSILFSSLVDDPAEHSDVFPTKEEQDAERERLLQIAGRLAEQESAYDVELLSLARNEIKKYTDGDVPVIFDPFAGSGSTPVEAHRLGLDSISSDVNAVAGMITTVVSDIPTRFSNIIPVHPKDEPILPIAVPDMEGFAEDVHYYGELLLERVYEKIGHLYPEITNPETGKQVGAFAWIWARTVKCPSPSCGCDIPLLHSYDLATKKGNEAGVEPITEDGKVRFKIRLGANKSTKKPKVAQTAVFRCPSCGEVTSDAYVKERGVNHKMENQMIAVVVDDGKKRMFLEVTDEQESAAKADKQKNVPHGELPDFPGMFAPPLFGLCDYSDLFTDRQLVFLTTMIQTVKDLQTEIDSDAKESGLSNDGISFVDGGSGSLAYAEAVRLSLMLTISKYIERSSNLCSWNNDRRGIIRPVYGRIGMPMVWEYVEANPFSGSSDFMHTLSRTCDTLAKLPTGGKSRTYVADGTEPNDVRDAFLLTDMPYYNRMPYQEMSDFFYVWLKYGLEDLYPEYFKGAITSRKEDMTSFPYRYKGDKKHADTLYVEGIKSAFCNLYTSATEKCPSVIGYLYKHNDDEKEELTEWEQFVTAICEAGFSIIASWQLGVSSGSNSKNVCIETPIYVVLRRKSSDAPTTTRRAFVSALKRELPVLFEDFAGKTELSSLRPSVIGKALNIYTRNKQVLDANGSVMQPYTASRIIEQEIDTLLLIYCQSEKVKEGS